MSNKTYDTLKWIAMIGIPVCTTAAGFFAELEYSWAPIVAMALGAIGTCLGGILKVMSDNYHKAE